MNKKYLIISIFSFAALAVMTGIGIAEFKLHLKGSSKTGSTKIENRIVENPELKLSDVIGEMQFSESENVEPPPEIADTQNGAANSDQAAQTGAKTFSFAVIGDTQGFKPGASGAFQAASAQIKKFNPDFVMALGDLNSSCDGKSGCEEKLNNWKSILGSLFSKTYATMGNHDRTGGSQVDALWQKFFNLPSNGPEGFSELVYSFNYNNSHFVVLDSEKPEEHLINGAQRTWLDQDLSKSAGKKTFVFFHEPAYPLKHKISSSLDVKPADRDALWNILSRHKVKAVFSGHEHITSRKKIGSLYQFGFGNTDIYDHELPPSGTAEYAAQGHNFGIVEVGESVTVKVYSTSGNLLNSFTF